MHPRSWQGAGKLSVAIGLGTIKHPELAITENPWYTSVPTVLPNTKVENDKINEYSELPGKFNGGKGKQNLYVDQIVAGYAVEGMSDAETAAEYVSKVMGGKQYLALKQQAWGRLQDYFAELAK